MTANGHKNELNKFPEPAPLTLSVPLSRFASQVTAILLCLFVTACSKWSLDTEWKSGSFRLVAIDAKSQMSLIHESSSVFLVGPTIFAVGADEKHIVLKQHPTDDAGRKFDRAITHYFIVGRDKSVRGPLKKEEFDQLAVSLALPSFTKVFDDIK